MTSCAFSDQLDAYLDGDASPEAARVVEEHVAECATCLEELSLAQRIQGAFREMSEETCPDDVFAAALARIERETTLVPGGVELHSTKRHASQRTRMTRDRAPRPVSPISRLRRWRVASAVVAGLAVLVAGIVFLRPMFEAPTAGPKLAEAETQQEPSAVPASDSSEEQVPALSSGRQVSGPEATPAEDPVVNPATRRAADQRVASPVSPGEATPDARLAAADDDTRPAPPSPEAEKARQEARLALSIVAEASRRGTDAAQENVDDSFQHVSEVLAVAFSK